MRIALKIDVASVKGATKGVPALLELFEQYKIKASFFFNSATTDEAGTLQRAWSRTKGLVSQGTSSAKAEKLAQAMLSVMEAGHEIGLRAHGGGEWVHKASSAGEDWTRHQMALAVEIFEQILGHAPRMFSAAGGQVNPHLFKFEEKLEFKFASDTRGKFPFLPVHQKMHSSCVQIPVTLPTLSEMLRFAEITDENVHEHMYIASRRILPSGHVYMAKAEQEGRDYLGYMEKMLVMWKGQEGEIQSLGDLYRALDLTTLPVHQVGWGQVQGNDRHLAMQSIKEAD